MANLVGATTCKHLLRTGHSNQHGAVDAEEAKRGATADACRDRSYRLARHHRRTPHRHAYAGLRQSRYPLSRCLGHIRLAEPTAFLAAIGGLLALIASIVTGLLYTWPVQVLLTSSVVLNKMAVTAFAATFWTFSSSFVGSTEGGSGSVRGCAGSPSRWAREGSSA